MNNKLDISTLDKIIAPRRHSRGEVNEVLPFASNDAKKMLKGSFKPVVGEFSRLVSNESLSKETSYTLRDDNEDYEIELIKRVTDNVDTERESDRRELKLLIEEYLFNNNSIEVIHPSLFKYQSLSPGNKKSLEKKVAKFLKDVLVNNDLEFFKNIFSEKGDEDLLVLMILSHLDELKERYNARTYQNILPSVSKLFMDDIKFLSKHKDFFLEHFQNLLQHYYFLYVSQLTFKFERFEHANYDRIIPIYYTLDWESLSKRRRSFEGFYNFRGLRSRIETTFVHLHTQYQLSHNWLNPERKFLTYSALIELLNKEATSQEIDEFIEDLNKWLLIYSEKMEISLEKKAQNIQEGFKLLYELLSKGMSKEVCLNFGKLIEDAAHGTFLKRRGSLGYTLNIPQDFLIVLTGLAVRDKERIGLKVLFEEFEKRGIILDRYSKQEVVNLLDSLNILEKKSDSGDAQYVKAIL